jgi:predicted ArsR family transcriptional regulator
MKIEEVYQLKCRKAAQYIAEGLGISRRTAVNYLTALENEGFLVSEKLGKERIYQNKRLSSLFRKHRFKTLLYV